MFFAQLNYAYVCIILTLNTPRYFTTESQRDGAFRAPRDFSREMLLMDPKNQKSKWGSKHSKLKDMKSHEVSESYNHFSIFEKQFFVLGTLRAPPFSVYLGLNTPLLLAHIQP